MRAKITVATLALALSGPMAASAAFAQTVGRPANDGGIPAEPGNAPQYNGDGPVVPAQEGSSCGRGSIPLIRPREPILVATANVIPVRDVDPTTLKQPALPAGCSFYDL